VAVGHFNVADLVLLKAVLAAAGEERVPVIDGASEGERDFLGTLQLAALVKSQRDESGLPIFLNADHTHSLAKARAAANAGFDLVAIDFSALPFEQNVSRTKEAVEALKTINPAILVEGEIGDIGTGSEIHEAAQNKAGNLTTPEEARQFAGATGIDVLAPAVGNMHGMLTSMVLGKTKKHLDVERIAEIKKAAGVFLTLHGGSGTDDKDLRNAIAAGINIIHINTELPRRLEGVPRGQPRPRPERGCTVQNPVAGHRFREASSQCPPETLPSSTRKEGGGVISCDPYPTTGLRTREDSTVE